MILLPGGIKPVEYILHSAHESYFADAMLKGRSCSVCTWTIKQETSGPVIVSQGAQGMKESWSECPCNVNCLSPAAESSWLCLPLKWWPEKKKFSSSISLTPCGSVILYFGHDGFPQETFPFVCLLTGHRQPFLLICCGYSWLHGNSNRNDTWVSALSLLFGEQKGNESSLTCWRGDGWGGLKHLSNSSPAGKVWLHEEAVPPLPPFSALGKVWSPLGKALQKQPVTVSWNITEALQHRELCYDDL